MQMCMSVYRKTAVISDELWNRLAVSTRQQTLTLTVAFHFCRSLTSDKMANQIKRH